MSEIFDRSLQTGKDLCGPIRHNSGSQCDKGMSLPTPFSTNRVIYPKDMSLIQRFAFPAVRSVNITVSIIPSLRGVYAQWSLADYLVLKLVVVPFRGDDLGRGRALFDPGH